MKNLKLITIIATALLTLSMFAVIPAFSVQPPIDTTTYYVGTIGQPARMDPARAYDTASGELIQNVAQTLIWWNDKNVVNFTAGIGHNLTLAEYANLDSYTPVLATALPVVVYNASGAYFTFTIRTTATFQPWTAANGSLISSRNLKASDVIYSFQRQMVYDSYYAPTWMWFGSAFTGAASVGLWNAYDIYGNGTFVNAADEIAAGALVQSWVYPGPGPNDVSFHFQQPWAQAVLQQIFAQTWGCIVEPEWVQEKGGWDGSFAVGWSNKYHWKPTVTRSEIDAWKDPAIYGVAGSKYPTGNKRINEIMGTGPYLFTSWDQVNKIWRIDQFAGYWGGWAGNHVTTVIEKGIDSWPTRKMLFLEGEFDVAVVPRANMYDLLTSTYNPAPGINLVYNVAGLSNDMMFFCMNVTATSSYQSFVGYPTHTTAAEAEFFANQNMRLAFAWAINYSQYIGQAYFGEAIQQASWWVDGLSPPAAKNTALALRNLNFAQMQSYLNAAVVDGHNVGSEGFETTILYNIGNDQRMIAAQLVASAFAALGSKYKVNVVGVDWPVFLDLMNSFGMPVYSLGWLADFADPHNFAQPYMQSTGNFPIAQGPPFPADQAIINAEIDAAIVETNVTQRILDYQDLQARFYNDVITLPLAQPVGRRFARDWVQGWYFNSLFPGLYAYDLYKSTTVLQNVDVNMQNTVTPPAPTPGGTYLYNNHMVVGGGNSALDVRPYYLHVTYAGGGAIATLYIAVGLAFTTGSTKNFANGTYVALAPGGAVNQSMTFWADGINVILAGTPTGNPYTLDGEAYAINNNAQDTNVANNVQAAGTLKVFPQIQGDINGDGSVDIYDAILLAGHFGQTGTSPGWLPAADINKDGIIDIYDAIILAGHFGITYPF